MIISRIKYNLFFILLISLISCFEKDEPVSPYPGEAITINNNINSFQSYFDFETGEVKAVNPVNDWQLGFESSRNGWHILVNSGANWFVWNTRLKDINASLPEEDPQNWAYDIQSEYPDSTAIGIWSSMNNQNRIYTDHVYILGKLSGNDYTDRKRIQFYYVDSFLYRFRFYDEVSGSFDSATIHKIDTAAFVYYNFQERNQLNFEPASDKYDIVFTTYYDLATQFGVTIPYLVRGVLLNISGCRAVLDSVNRYSGIDYEMLDQYQFLSQRDIIGYRWKNVNVNASEGGANYTVLTHYNYIIETPEGNFFKMRFLSYSLNGESGYPRFEMKELNPIQ